MKSKRPTETKRRSRPSTRPVPGRAVVPEAPVRVAWRAEFAARPAVVRWGLVLGLALSLVLLLAHAAHYTFLTDDAYISFRYARNLANGYGLVFNPGHEPVEGYSNFLFVLALAAFQRLGVVPEVMAHVLTIAATLALWGSVAWFSLRRLPPSGREWLALVPVFLLAATRSIAVWSTSGLETRWFEALLVGGALRLVVEVEAAVAGRASRPIAPWLFALAAWTRPDGLLLAACAFGIAAARLRAAGRLDIPRFALRLAPFVALVGGHFLWRHAYYGYWLPNTYYAKVGGKLWWSSGVSYGIAFALEYAMYLWIPFVAAGVARRFRLGEGFVPLLFGAMILPHALYVTAIGGDHFEYRPLDLYFPFLYLFVGDGLAELLERRPRWAPAAAAAVLVMLAGIWELPAQSRRQFPRDRYLPGFPGCQMDQVEARAWLNPARSGLYRWPGLSWIAQAHRDRLVALSSHFAGLRQEEHEEFLSTVIEDGKVLHGAVERGLIPADTHVAMACVGAIPYYSNLRTLDMLGLTDAHVAHSPSLVPQRAMAHDKQASVDYARSRGVDLWAVEGVHTVVHVTSTAMLSAVRSAVSEAGRFQPYFAASLGDGWYVIVYLLQGRAQAAQRFPRLHFRWVGDREFVEEYLREGIAAYRDRLGRDPGNHRSRLEMAYLLLIDHQFAEADAIYRDLARAMPEDPDLWENWSTCREKLGDLTGAAESLRRALAISEARTDTSRVIRFREGLARLEIISRPPPG